MATRRNVPSKDVFRAIRNNVSPPFVAFSESIVNTRSAVNASYYNTRAYSAAKARPRTSRSYASTYSPGTFSRWRARIPHGTKLDYEDFSKRLSTTSRSNVAALVELSLPASGPLPPIDVGKPDASLHLRVREAKKKSHPTKVKPRKQKVHTKHSRDNHGADAAKPPPRNDPHVAETNDEEDLLLVPPYIAPEQSSPLYFPQKTIHYEKRSPTKQPQIKQDVRLDYLYNRIILVRNRVSHGAALQAAESILKSYVVTKLNADWELVRKLYMKLCHHLGLVDLRVIRYNIVKSMLQESPPRLKAVSLLMEKIEPTGQITSKHIRSYLEEFCDDQTDLDLQLSEAGKIFRSVRNHPALCTTEILLPLVRRTVAKNDPDLAREFTMRFTREYRLSTHFGILSEIVTGYARQENMSAIDEVLSELHSAGYSRSKPYAFAALVRTVFHFLVAFRQPEHTFDFLTYTMQNHGLVPTSMLSISVVKHFVASKRYDLVHQWIHLQQKSFPNVLNSTNTPLAAYEINEAWMHTLASPADVLSTCKALAFGALRTPFSDEFRHMTNNWLMKCLFAPMRQVSQLIGTEYNPNLKQFSSLSSMIEYTEKLLRTIEHKELDTRRSLVVDTFHKKVRLARQAELLVNHFSDYVQNHGPILKFGKQELYDTKVVKKQTFRPSLPGDVLIMTGSKLAEAVLKTYHDGHSVDDRDKSEIVVNTVRHLQVQRRHRDCAILIQTFWESGHATGRFPIHEIVTIWIRMAYELRDPKMLHAALQAVVDSSAAHIIGYRFLMLIRAVVSVITEEVRLGKLQQYPNQSEELQYLVSRCYRRRWQQEGSPDAENIADPYLKKWKMEQDSSEKMTQVSYEYIL